VSEVVATAEGVVREALASMVEARPEECLSCYLLRVLGHVGCDGELTLSRRWLAGRRPRPGVRGLRTTRFAEELGRRGGFCDCEVLFNCFASELPDDASTPLPPCTHGRLRWRR